MATRGKVKTIKDMGNSGSVTDTVNKIDYNFEQPMGQELGIVEGKIVRMEIITKSDGTQLAVSLDPVEKAKIQTMDVANNTGTLVDNGGNVLKFVQNYMTELGFQVGDKVTYSMVMSGGAWIATTLQKV